jgi:ArsR family transcriptional regulator
MMIEALSRKSKMDEALTSDLKTVKLVELLKVLAEPNRLLILNLLMEGVQCNCNLGDALQMAPNLISHHLSVLREAGLVNVERDPLDARWVYYSVNNAAIQELNSTFTAFFSHERIQPRQKTCGPKNLGFSLVDDDPEK